MSWYIAYICPFMFLFRIGFDWTVLFLVLQIPRIWWIPIIGSLIRVLKPLLTQLIGELNCNLINAKELSTKC